MNHGLWTMYHEIRNTNSPPCLEFTPDVSSLAFLSGAIRNTRQLSSVFCVLSSVICRLSSVLCPLSSALYNCRGFFTNRPFYAKQTQFPKGQNERKLLIHKGLSKFYPAGGAKKQTQFKPNQTQSPKSQNECKLNFNKGLQKKR